MVLIPRALRAAATSLNLGAIGRLRESKESEDAFARSLQPIVRIFLRKEVARQALLHGADEDLTQDVLIHVWRGLPHLRATDETRFLAWLWRIAHHVVANAAQHEESVHRVESRWPGTRAVDGRLGESSHEFDEDYALADGPSPSERVMAKEREDAVAYAIGQLEQRQRDALMEWVIRGQTLVVIARRHGVSESKMQRDVHETLRRLEELLDRFTR